MPPPALGFRPATAVWPYAVPAYGNNEETGFISRAGGPVYRGDNLPPPPSPDTYSEGVDNRDEIRDFLATRRAKITPEQVGLPSGGRRRVPGLRREEVAVLAGVSTEWYTRLEKGHITGVSDDVLNAVVRALHLDDAERAHLFDLARAAGPGHPLQRRPATPRQLGRHPRPHGQPATQADRAAPGHGREHQAQLTASAAPRSRSDPRLNRTGWTICRSGPGAA
ncbi:helix-turn-helix domain-containing protein [Microtetraspora fusca]|uniref:helix-turn-helix domain-containing protein n=1 Tax=Microtetraspora fusca TaxID=1997 RepID=UPI00402BA8A0